MKKSVTILGLALISSTVFAAQTSEPNSITCKIQVIEMMDTKVEKIISEKTINPIFKTAGRDGTEYKKIVDDKQFKIGLTLSFLKYTPLLELSVQTGKVTTTSGLRTVVSTSGSENSTVVECSYIPGE